MDERLGHFLSSSSKFFRGLSLLELQKYALAESRYRDTGIEYRGGWWLMITGHTEPMIEARVMFRLQLYGRFDRCSTAVYSSSQEDGGAEVDTSSSTQPEETAVENKKAAPLELLNNGW